VHRSNDASQARVSLSTAFLDLDAVTCLYARDRHDIVFPREHNVWYNRRPVPDRRAGCSQMCSQTEWWEFKGPIRLAKFAIRMGPIL